MQVPHELRMSQGVRLANSARAVRWLEATLPHEEPRRQ